MALHAKTRQIMETRIPNRETFTRGNVSAKLVDEGHYRSGSAAWLPQEFVKILNAHSEKAKLYVVYSRQTPIAWCLNGTWYFPNTKYSTTTTQHQNAVRYSLRGENVVFLEEVK